MSSKPMTDARLTEIRTITDAAYNGPWVARTFDFAGKEPKALVTADKDDIGICATQPTSQFFMPQCPEQNAAFIAMARTAIPELLDEVERLRNELKQQSSNSHTAVPTET